MKKFLLAAALLIPAPAMATTFSVYTGYADNLRPSGFYPNPFYGSPNVVFEGENPNTNGNNEDSGAIRIDNLSGGSLTINSVDVLLGGRDFNLWSPATLAAGQILVLAQTNGQNFDTSDVCGGTAASPNAACVATVTVTYNGGSTAQFQDLGQRLSTFGYDIATYGFQGGPDTNESIGWQTIGNTTTDRGNVPEPATLAVLGSGLFGLGLLRRRRG